MTDRSGRTLAEVLVAMSLVVFVGAVVSAFQANGTSWHLADQKAVALLRPVRDAADYLARDIRLTDRVECCADGVLVLHQKGEVNLLQVSYWLEGDKLMRGVIINYDSVNKTTRQVVRGLLTFTPTLEGERVRVVLGAASQEPDPALFEALLELVPRVGVMP